MEAATGAEAAGVRAGAAERLVRGAGVLTCPAEPSFTDCGHRLSHVKKQRTWTALAAQV
jgi:hypothetical protein